MRNVITNELLGYSWDLFGRVLVYGPKSPFSLIYCYIGLFGTCLFLGRAPRTKETLPDFHERCMATRHSLVFPRVDR